MTNEQRKQFIEEQIEIFPADCEMGEFLRDIAKLQPCTDAISRQAALECLDWKYPDKLPITKIMELPSVTPQPKMGKWIKKEYWKPLPYDTEPLDYDYYDEKTHSEKIYLYCCSECGKDEGEIKPTDKYCPNCGAKMEVEE